MKSGLFVILCISAGMLGMSPQIVLARQLHENIAIERVNVYLTAMDDKGRFVTDLRPQELILKENGVVQTITDFGNLAGELNQHLGEQEVPLTVAFVIDSSESMGADIQSQTKIDIVKNASFRLLDELRSQDRMMLVSFNDAPEEVTPMTGDKKKMEQDLLFQEVEGGSTALLDSIYFALEKLKKEWGRRMIVVCSDGEDTASHLHLDEVRSNLIAADVTILAFGTMGLTSTSLRGRYILENLAEATGGYAFFPTSLNALDAVMEKLKKGLRSQYSVAYQPSNQNKDGSWRKIEITSLRKGLKLRYRNGYSAN